MLVLRLPRFDEEGEFYRAHRATSPVYPSFLHYYEEGLPFARYLEILGDREAGIGLPGDQVPSTILFGFVEQRIVGRVSIRHHLNPRWVRSGGHIGYVVVPEFRRRGYATAMLLRSLELARDRFGLLHVLVTCDADNLASKRTIEKCGGVLEDVYAGPDVDTPTCRYWIDTTPAAAEDPLTGRTSQVGRFLVDLIQWVADRPDIVAAGLLGSYARGDARPDSDVDIMLLTGDPRRYLVDQRWVADLGEVADHHVEPHGRVTSVRARYADGLEVEYDVVPEEWAALPPDEGTERVVTSGMRVLFERTPTLSRLLSARPERASRLPCQGPMR